MDDLGVLLLSLALMESPDDLLTALDCSSKQHFSKVSSDCTKQIAMQHVTFRPKKRKNDSLA
jgi:hypothetical protein